MLGVKTAKMIHDSGGDKSTNEYVMWKTKVNLLIEPQVNYQ